MNHKLLIEFIHLLFEFEKETEGGLVPTYPQNIEGFKTWIHKKKEESIVADDTALQDTKVTTEQHIALALLKIANYSKVYWRSLLADKAIATQDNWIVLLNLWIHGEMTKMELIRLSAQEKPTGMQIINRLIQLEFVRQKDSEVDKRSKIIEITALGQREVTSQMGEIQYFAQMINGDLHVTEKQSLLFLLTKLSNFHEDIFKDNKSKMEVLDFVLQHRAKV
ncbi:MarR family winged helix-turn-helix transcriptional regulator [Myroides fluvii]|uniref:MarR family winged helix-turn-helix transcriptional regulator n=1 Tax=Myroides fluvii TaxID=2572594 RepID=UPI00131AD6A0|nr:helix-turn-helix domain-containing protein [Myroides fluvii]